MIETLNALRQSSFCARLDEAALLALAQIAAKVEHPPGTIIQLEGDPGEAMYLAELLLIQAEAAARDETVAPLTQAEIAARLGTVREMVGRTLKGFEIQGLIRIERGVVMVVDRTGLEEQAERQV